MGKKMTKIRYSETGRFTENQIKLCKEISDRLRRLRKSGCSVIAKQDRLSVFKSDEIQFSNLINPFKSYSNDYPIPHLNAGYINDSGADDTEFFIDEVLDFSDSREDD